MNCAVSFIKFAKMSRFKIQTETLHILSSLSVPRLFSLSLIVDPVVFCLWQKQNSIQLKVVAFRQDKTEKIIMSNNGCVNETLPNDMKFSYELDASLIFVADEMHVVILMSHNAMLLQ